MKDNGESKLVSIGVPIYRRLEYIPKVLEMLESQDYPAIELIISDNGMNGTNVRDIVQTRYSRPYRFRQNPATVDISKHFNQIIKEASGEYFVMLNDDDEITPNYVSELVGQLERHPEASFAIARQEIIDKDGVLLRTSKGTFPETLSGPDCIRAIWQTYQFDFECVESIVSRTKFLKENGGYPDFPKGNGTDNAVLIKLCVTGSAAFSSNCVFRWRVHESGYGWSATIDELAASSRLFIRWLDTDPTVVEFGRRNPAEWRELKDILVSNEWRTYLWRWNDLYKKRLSGPQWFKAAFAMPFIPSYYRKVAEIFYRAMKAHIKRTLQRDNTVEPEKAVTFKGS
jgi:glycosyltransferase involved in cell wall biosynthesis